MFFLTGTSYRDPHTGQMGAGEGQTGLKQGTTSYSVRIPVTGILRALRLEEGRRGQLG